MSSRLDLARQMARSGAFGQRAAAVGLLEELLGRAGADRAGADRADSDRAADTSAEAWDVLVSLLADPDPSVVGTAAAALLRQGTDGWESVATYLWSNEDTQVAEQMRGVAVERILDGDPVEDVLERLAATGTSSAARKGAVELLMSLGMRPVELIEDDDD